MASTVGKKKAGTSTTSGRPSPPHTRRVSIDEERLAELIKRSVREALEEARALELDELEWDRQFAGSQDVLNRMADEAAEEFRQGKTEPLVFENGKLK